MKCQYTINVITSWRVSVYVPLLWRVSVYVPLLWRVSVYIPLLCLNQFTSSANILISVSCKMAYMNGYQYKTVWSTSNIVSMYQAVISTKHGQGTKQKFYEQQSSTHIWTETQPHRQHIFTDYKTWQHTSLSIKKNAIATVHLRYSGSQFFFSLQMLQKNYNWCNNLHLRKCMYIGAREWYKTH